MSIGVGVHAAGNRRVSLYDGHVIPFLWLRDGTHPLAARTCEPRPLAQARQIRPAPPVGAEKPGARPTGRFEDNPSGVSRFGGQAGTQAPTLRPHQPKTTEAGPEAQSTVSLPSRVRARRRSSQRRGHRPQPNRAHGAVPPDRQIARSVTARPVRKRASARWLSGPDCEQHKSNTSPGIGEDQHADNTNKTAFLGTRRHDS